MGKYNLKRVVVEYETTTGEAIIDKVDNMFEKIAKECGLEFVGSGFDLRKGKRDLEYKIVEK